MGNYVIRKNRVQFSQIASTMMACAQRSRDRACLPAARYWKGKCSTADRERATLTLMGQEKKPVTLFGVVWFLHIEIQPRKDANLNA